MKKVKITTAIITVLALTFLAGEAIGQPAGRGRGGQGWGSGPGWGPGIAGRPQMNADSDSAQPDDSWVPGPYCPWGQGPDQNIQPRQGRGPGGGFGRNFQGPRGPYCPYGQGPNQNIQERQGRGPGRFNRDFQGRGQGGYGQGFHGRGQGPRGQGFGRQDMMMQRGPGAGRGGRGFQNAGPGMSGRGGRGFGRGNMSVQGWGMNNRQGQPGPGGRGGQGPGMRPQQFVPDNDNQNQTNQPTTPRGRGWTPGNGPGTRQGWGPNWGQNWTPNSGQDWTPDWNLKPQPEKAPDANATEPPVVEDRPEQPQGE